MSKSQFKINIAKRVVLSALFILSSFLLPWWLVIIIGLFLAFYFKNFYEFILSGLILDSLYGKIISIENFYFIFTLITTIATLLMISFKKLLR
jgi:hypothetical protein